MRESVGEAIPVSLLQEHSDLTQNRWGCATVHFFCDALFAPSAHRCLSADRGERLAARMLNISIQDTRLAHWPSGYDLASLGARMGLYMGTVILALLLHFMLTLPILVRTVGKARPYRHMANMSTPLLTAFSTSSSGATLPLTIKAVEMNSGVSNKISSFTLPLGATINMDGTALYECVAAMFIAQAYGVDLTIMQQLIVVITALLASIGAAAIPMAGLVMITVILTAVGLPLEGVGLILAVDRILDMFRTATNVWSDSCGAVIIAKSEGETLAV